MSDEPTAKKLRLEEEDEDVKKKFVFTERGELSDLTICVQDFKYFVSSNKLKEHSEFFRIALHKMSGEKEMKIEDFEAGQVKSYLLAIFKPTEVIVTKENIEQLIKVFIGFHSTVYLNQIFKEKGVATLFSVKYLLQVASDTSFIELKDEMENLLIDEFKGKIDQIEIRNGEGEFHKLITKSLRISFKYDLEHLKVLVEKLLLEVYGSSNHSSKYEAAFLYITEKYNLPDLKSAIETRCIGKFLEKFKRKRGGRPLASAKADYHINGKIADFLELAEDRCFILLKNKIDAWLVIEYKNGRHDIVFEKEFVDLMNKYELELLKDSVKNFVSGHFFKVDGNTSILDFYLGQTTEMVELKEEIVNDLIEEFSEKSPAITSLNLIASNCSKYELEKLKDVLEDYLIENIRENDEEPERLTIESLWETFENYFAFDKDVKPPKKEKDLAVLHLCNLTKLATKYQLEKFKKELEECMVDSFADIHSKTVGLMENLLQIANFGLVQLKKQIEDAMKNHFEKKKVMFIQNDFMSILDTCKVYKLHSLQNSIVSFLVEEFGKIDQNRKLKKEEIIKIVAEHNLEPLKTQIEETLIEEFENGQKDYEKYAKIAEEKKFLKLKGAIEQYLIAKWAFDRSESDINRFCFFAEQFKFEELKNSLSQFFIDHFDSQMDFKYVKFAFAPGMVKFKETLFNLVKTSSNKKSLWEAGKDNIQLLTNHQKSVLKALFKEPEEI